MYIGIYCRLSHDCGKTETKALTERANVTNKRMLTAIFSQPRSDGVHSSKNLMVNRLLQSLFAARKLNYIIMYIRHYKILKKQRKLQLYIQYIASQRQIKGKLANDLNFVQKFGIGC